jgi:hypothetical protein
VFLLVKLTRVFISKKYKKNISGTSKISYDRNPVKYRKQCWQVIVVVVAVVVNIVVIINICYHFDQYWYRNTTGINTGSAPLVTYYRFRDW